MKTVKQILLDHLKSIGADGLCGEDCGCGIDNLAPSGDLCCMDCVPARFVPLKKWCNPDELEDFPDGYYKPLQEDA